MAGNVFTSVKKVVAQDTPGATRIVPSGLTIEKYGQPSAGEIAVTYKLMRWPAVPLNLRLAFCPGTVVVSVTVEPPIVIVPVTSWMLFNAIVTLPVEVADASINIV